MQEVGAEDQVANHARVIRSLEAGRRFHGQHRCHGVIDRANATDTPCDVDGVARIFPLQQNLKSVKLLAAALRRGDSSVLIVSLDCDLEMPFQTGDGV
jgi:hypothetical protein